MKSFLKYLSILLIAAGMLSAQPPTPSQVSSQVSSLWQSNQIGQLDTYITDLITQNPTYVPAIVAASFHDAVFEGKLASAKSRLESIKTDGAANPNKYTEEFLATIDGLITELEHEIAMHSRHGTSDAELESNASASDVRSAWGATILPQIRVLEIADGVTL